ncbi:MAG TPA: FTR1 family protein [Myxococcaceae bacterium]|nr:FTR1 family protein [Myxococcaceae bacterium]
MSLGSFVALGVLLAGSVSAPRDPAEEAKSLQRLVAILQYLESDYPRAVQSQSDAELAEQNGFAQEAVDEARGLLPAGSPFLTRLASLQERIRRGTDPDGVARDCRSLEDDLVTAGGLARSPGRPPDFERGKELYAVACAACHGADGSGQVEIAATMDPKPASFLSGSTIDELTPYKAFNGVSLGVTGTAMPAYAVLSDADRWALSFFVFTLRQPPCEGKTPPTTLEKLANTSDAELAREYTPREIACLRRNPPQTDEEQSLLTARSGLDDALRLAGQGKGLAARQAVMDAYLNGIEPVEPLLRARVPGQVDALEAAFAQLRAEADGDPAQFQTDARKLIGLIDQVRRGHSPTNAGSVFLATLLILLREGFEATVVIAALLAMLKKMEQQRHARVVHLGWSSALLLGIAAFAFARHLLAGTRREWLEAVVALAAVAMLLYAALWLNARKNIRRTMAHLRDQMQGALGRGSVIGLFVVAFTAMLRESFETALFLQGLSIDSPTGVLWGALAGAALLTAMVAMVTRVGYRLPMKALFNGSTVLLYATAVVLLGKGLHALQELGTLGVRPLPFPTVDFIGIYPDAISLVPQLLLVCAPLIWWLFRHDREVPPPTESSPSESDAAREPQGDPKARLALEQGDQGAS